MRNGLFIFIFLLLVAGCRREPAVTVYRVAKAPVPRVRGTSAASYQWVVPEGWQPRPVSPMRLASFRIPVNGEQADCSVVELSGRAGGLVANVNRWRGQLGLPSLDEQAIRDGLIEERSGLGPFFVARITGEEAAGPAILAAIYPLPGKMLFVKVRSSAQALEAIRAPFLSFCRSFAPAVTPSNEDVAR